MAEIWAVPASSERIELSRIDAYRTGLERKHVRGVSAGAT